MAMNGETRKRMILKTAEIYRLHAKMLRAATRAIRKMDGKLLDKRVETALAEAVESGKTFYYMECVTAGGMLKLKGRAMNNSYRIVNDKGETTCTVGYTENRSEVFEIGEYADVFDTTPGGKWKLKADGIIPAMEIAADSMEEQADKTEAVLDQIKEMEEEFQKIADALNASQKKYSWAARDMTGLRYDLHYSGPLEAKNYNVRI